MMEKLLNGELFVESFEIDENGRQMVKLSNGQACYIDELED